MITKLFTKKNVFNPNLEKYLDQYYGLNKKYYLEVESEDTIYILAGEYGQLTAKYVRRFIELELGWIYNKEHPSWNPKLLIIKRKYLK